MCRVESVSETKVATEDINIAAGPQTNNFVQGRLEILRAGGGNQFKKSRTAYVFSKEASKRPCCLYFFPARFVQHDIFET